MDLPPSLNLRTFLSLHLGGESSEHCKARERFQRDGGSIGSEAKVKTQLPVVPLKQVKMTNAFGSQIIEFNDSCNSQSWTPIF